MAGSPFVGVLDRTEACDDRKQVRLAVWVLSATDKGRTSKRGLRAPVDLLHLVVVEF